MLNKRAYQDRFSASASNQPVTRSLGAQMYDELVKIFQREDDLAVVIRSHIILEQYLNRLIERKLKDIAAFREMRLEFHQTVKLAVSMGLNSRVSPFLNAIGTLRNGFAHKLRPDITKQDAENIYKTLHENEKKALQVAAKKLKETHPHEWQDFSNLTPRNKYTLCVITVCSALEFALSYAPNKHGQQDAAIDAAPLL